MLKGDITGQFVLQVMLHVSNYLPAHYHISGVFGMKTFQPLHLACL